MSRFLLLVITSIWTRISFSTTILEPSVSDGTSLATDASNPFDSGRSIIGSEVASIDAESNLFANGELTPSYDCFSYNVPFKAKLRGRRCDYSNLRTKPQTAPGGKTQTSPKSHGGPDPQEPNDPSDETNSPPSDAEPEEEFDGFLNNLIIQDPWVQCRKYLRGLLKYPVCDNPDVNYAIYQPLPLVYPNAPFWSLFHCTLVVSNPGLGLYTCPDPISRIWCCWEYDVDQNVGLAVGCLTLYYLQLAGDVFPVLYLSYHNFYPSYNCGST